MINVFISDGCVLYIVNTNLLDERNLLWLILQTPLYDAVFKFMIIEEPVVYVKRRYLDYDSNIIVNGVPDDFVESLTHDSIIVQIPFLKGRLRNRLERLLRIFDQEYCVKGN